MSNAVYPGSFDPVTYGHIDVIKRASHLFDTLTVSVLNNGAKTPLFSVDERVKMLQDVCRDIPNVRVDSFEYELQMAQTNRKLAPEADTVFLTTSLEYAYLSSTTVKEVAFYGGDISKFVPHEIEEMIHEKYLLRSRNGK